MVNGKLTPLHKISRLIESLKPIRKRRVYASPDKKAEIAKFVKEFLESEEVSV